MDLMPSGGPLFNHYGHLMGVFSFQHLNADFAVSFSLIEKFLFECVEILMRAHEVKAGTKVSPPVSENTSFSASKVRHSSNSTKSFSDKATFSARHNFSGDLYSPFGRQDSSASQYKATHGEDLIPTNHSSFHSRFTSGNDLHGQRQDLRQYYSSLLTKSSQVNTSSSKDLLEDTKDTIVELRAKAKMWERNARKSIIDLDLLRRVSSEKLRHKADLDMELSAAFTGKEGLKLEMEQVKRLLEESKLIQMASEHSISHAEVSHLQLHSSQDKACKLQAQFRNTRVEMEERGMEMTSLQKDLKGYRDKRTSNTPDWIPSETRPHKLDIESSSPEDLSEVLLELLNQLKVALTRVKKPWCKGSSPVNIESETDYTDSVHSDFANVLNHKLQAPAILRNFTELNELLEAKILEFETGFEHIEVELMDGGENVSEAEENLEEYEFEEGASYHSTEVRGSSETDLAVKVADMGKIMLAKGTQIEELEAGPSLKEGEIQVLKHSQKEMEERISDLEKEKVQLEEILKNVSRGSSITSKCLDDVRNDMTMLTSNLDSHAPVNKTLESKSPELQSTKCEVELHLLQLEEENVQLSELLSGMEAQLRYLTNEKELSRLDVENSKSLSTDLCSEIKRLEIEIESQKLDLKQKLQEVKKRWSEAQEECQHLKRANPKLQAMTENFIEERDSMQKLNGELCKQILELWEQCAHLEAGLRESRNNLSDCCRRIEILETRLYLMQEDMNSKQDVFTYELDSLLHENKEHKEKLILEESLLSEKYTEKSMLHLTEQISATHDERQKIAPNAVHDIFTLRADKEKLECTLQEAQAICKSSDTKWQNFQQEIETIVQGLQSELAFTRRYQDLMTADNEKLQRLLDEVKLSEAKFRSTMSGLELKLTASEHGSQQAVEEIADLKIQLQKIGQLLYVIVDLKNSLNQVKFEKGKLEASLHLLSGDYEELEADKNSYIENISSMQKFVSELDDSKHCMGALEEKLLQLGGDLNANEALCAQDAELKNVLNRIERVNSQFQCKKKSLQDVKDKWLKRAQVLQDELNLKKKGNQQSESISKDSPGYESITGDGLPQEELKHLESGKLENGSAENKKRSTKIKESGQHRKETNDDNDVDLVGKIKLLEYEFSKVLEAIQMYKLQLKKLLTDGEYNNAIGPETSTAVEVELKDIRESLRFASARRACKLIKNLKSGSRWFS